MKKGRIIFIALLALFLVVGIGIVSARVLMAAPSCHCYAGCYYCDWETGKCKTYDGPGACFCHNNPDCDLVEQFLCCEQM